MLSDADNIYSSEIGSQSRLNCGPNEWVEFGLENIGELSISKDRIIRKKRSVWSSETLKF